MTESNASLRHGWMGHLQADQHDASLLYLTIPGTHDTGTWNLSNQAAPAISKCQEWTLEEQLDHGIRFIDIRLVPELNDGQNDLKLYHGANPDFSADCEVWFSEIVQTVINE
jgi:1-phosphatidylinositol phosphodiesterase